MSLTVQSASTLHHAWLAERTGYAPQADFRAIEAVDEHRRIRGMVGFDHWRPNSAEMHVAVDSISAVRALLRPAFEYLFRQAGKGVALGVVPGNNAKALRFDKHLGFRETHRIRDGWAEGVDLIVLELRAESCRYLKENA